MNSETHIELRRAHTLITRYREALTDVMVMFEEIEHNRTLPPLASTLQQYIKMGHSIRKLLEEG